MLDPPSLKKRETLMDKDINDEVITINHNIILLISILSFILKANINLSNKLKYPSSFVLM